MDDAIKGALIGLTGAGIAKVWDFVNNQRSLKQASTLHEDDHEDKFMTNVLADNASLRIERDNLTRRIVELEAMLAKRR